MEQANEFSTYEFYEGGSYTALCKYVSAKQSVDEAQKVIVGPDAKSGKVKRVIITDGGDCTNFEWEYGKGITFPPPPPPPEGPPSRLISKFGG